MCPIKTIVIVIVRSRVFHALHSQLHKIGYTQHCDVPLRWVRTLDFDRSESRQRNRLFFHSFLPAMASDHTITELSPRITVFITCLLCDRAFECAGSGGAKTSLSIKRTSSNWHMFPYRIPPRVISACTY